ncbi:MAG TPA: J domain-containing protein [Candidatus Aquabacterium excrementipullorum]|nr:J domain-containing protein [Candidatus Aquabacterium excrementipullorum]
MTPPFLAHLGLQGDADERDIKRAYARLLKQIDQATDAAAFQALREAYEAALHWHRQGGVSSPVPPPTTPMSPPPSAAPAPEPAPAPAPAPRVQRPQAQAPSRPAPPSEVLAVFLQFMDRLGTHGNKASMHQALVSSLEDPHLQSLDARHTFEGLIANALAKGWKPGHDILMAAAIELFEWRKDPSRLLRWGPAGAEIEQSIADQAVFDSQPAALQQRLREVVRLLRATPLYDDAAKAEIHRADLEILLVQFGSWLRMHAPAERVRQWRQWAKKPPERSALLAALEINVPAPSPRPPPMPAPKPKPAAAAAPLAPEPPQRPKPTGKKVPALWFFLGLVVGMAGMFAAIEGVPMFRWGSTAAASNEGPDPLDAVKASFKPRELPPGYGPPQGRPPYPPPPPPRQAQPPAPTGRTPASP